MHIGKVLNWKSDDVKLLRITIDGDLKFYKHALKLCSKVNQKLSALLRMAKLHSFNKKGIFESCYGVSIWTCHSRKPTTKLIGFMKEPVELFVMMTSQLLISFLPWVNLSVFTLNYSDTLHWKLQGSSRYFWEKFEFIKRENTISLRSKPESVIPSVNSVLKAKN